MTDDGRVAAEPALPQPVAENHNRRPAGSAVLLGQKGASQRRLDPERPEVTGRNDLRDDALGFSASRDVRVGARESCYALEGGGRPAEMLELRIGPPELAGASCRARASQIQHRETVGLGKGERTEQGRVDQAVDGR